jgi:YbgC/YbaW family acyl-CoA thioester hydrolase
MPDEPHPPLTARHRVKSYELDSFGHVNNAVYLNLFEGARNEYMLQRGLSFADFSVWKAHPIVAEAWVRYRRAAFVDDKLVILGAVENASNVSFTIRYRIEREGDGQWLAEGTTRMAFVDPEGKPTRIPQAFKEKFIESRGV